MARRTKDEAVETRNQILDAAERIFGERGVSRTSLTDIAQAADVTRGAIYWHFKDKADLFNAMMERVTLPMEVSFSSEATDSEGANDSGANALRSRDAWPHFAKAATIDPPNQRRLALRRLIQGVTACHSPTEPQRGCSLPPR